VKSLTPNFKRLNPLSKLRELPRQNIPSLLQAVVLLPLFASAVYGIVQDNWSTLLKMPLQEAETGARQMAISVQSLLWKAAMLFVILGAVDLWRQNRRYTADLRMSKQDLREESKEMEGNPQIRGRLRQLRREWLRRRMMSQVPKATAVVVNPTHYAVAIRYVMDSMAAPIVVAKGRNFVAQRIRLLAIHHQVPVIENPRWRRRSTKRRKWGKRFRRTCSARWPKCWLTSIASWETVCRAKSWPPKLSPSPIPHNRPLRADHRRQGGRTRGPLGGAGHCPGHGGASAGFPAGHPDRHQYHALGGGAAGAMYILRPVEFSVFPTTCCC